MVAGATFRAQDVRIFRPYPDEVPWELLAAGDELPAYAESAQMRIAKHQDQVLGAYVIEPLDSLCFRLVHLAVVPSCQRRGLGRWLLGHAIGLAESRGARQIVACSGANGRFLLAAAGFIDTGNGFELALSPE